MKGLAGGLIHNSACAYAFMCQPQFAHVEPIWGIQREWELDEFLSYQEQAPELNEALLAEIRKDKEQLAGEFCRGCGYCMPCPAGIEINNCARNESDVKTCAAGCMAVQRVAGKDEKDRELSPLRQLYEEVSVRPEYTGAFETEL